MSLSAISPKRTWAVPAIAATVAAVLLAASLTVASAGAAASAGDGPQAVSAKKRCKAKCKKNRATTFLKGHSYSRVSSSPTTGASSTERSNLCVNGSLNFRGEYNGFSGAWLDTYDGTWRVVAATKTSAQVAVTTSNFRSVYFDGSPGPGTPPPAAATVGVQVLSNVQVLIGGVEFSRGTGAC